MPVAYFIRRRGDECSIIKIHLDGREEILEHGLTLVETETLYFVCIGEPVHEAPLPRDAVADDARPLRARLRQLALKF